MGFAKYQKADGRLIKILLLPIKDDIFGRKIVTRREFAVHPNKIFFILTKILCYIG